MSEKGRRQGALGKLMRVCRRYRAVESAGRFFSQLVGLSTPGLVALLTALFISRVLWPPLFYAVYAVPAWLAAVGAYLVFRPGRWLVPSAQASAVVDVHSGSRGLYMALQEAEGEEWARDLPERKVRVRTHFPARSTAWAGALAAALAGLMFMPDLTPSPRLRPGARTPVKRMSDVVKELKAEKLADEDYVKDTEKLLEKLKRKRAQTLDSEDWQALDRAREELQKQTLDSYRRLRQAAEEAGRLAGKLARGRKLSPEEARKAAELLDKFPAGELEKLAKQGGAQLSVQQMKQLLSKAGRGKAGFSAAQAKALARMLAGMEGKFGEKAGKCGSCLGGLGFSQQQLAGLLKPGAGGVSRGPGPAKLQHTGSTDPDLGQFKAKTFEGGEGAPTATVGTVTAPPDEGDIQKSTGGRAAVRQFGPGNERITWRSRLLPRHNDALQRYFESEGEGSE